MNTKFKAIVFVLFLHIVAFAVPTQNAEFRLLQTVFDVDSDANGMADSSLVWSYTYDHRNLVRAVSENDFNADGIIDHRSTVTFGYDRYGNRISGEGES